MSLAIAITNSATALRSTSGSVVHSGRNDADPKHYTKLQFRKYCCYLFNILLLLRIKYPIFIQNAKENFYHFLLIYCTVFVAVSLIS